MTPPVCVRTRAWQPTEESRLLPRRLRHLGEVFIDEGTQTDPSPAAGQQRVCSPHRSLDQYPLGVYSTYRRRVSQRRATPTGGQAKRDELAMRSKVAAVMNHM